MVKRFCGLVLLVIILAGFSPTSQNVQGEVNLNIRAGFDGSFRENLWTPVYVIVSNPGQEINGQVIVRPETSSNAVDNTFSLPINLPTGSQKNVFLYIALSGFASQIRVELLLDDGSIVANETVNVRALQPRDQLHILITESPSSSIDLSRVHDAGYNAIQSNWRIEHIPDRAVALEAVDTIVFSDVDTSRLSTAQLQVMYDWVARGGHLIVTGGASWQRTASGLSSLLPFVPDNSTTVENLTPLAEWLRFGGDQLTTQTIISTGSLINNANVLVKSADDLPLLIRRTLGGGVIDYITAAPSALPLRGWGGMGDLWLTLATTINPLPGWSNRSPDWDIANSAVNILPGVNLLPDLLPLCGFLSLYIALIGPLNYVVLNRINRREYAWITIPLFIIIFSVLSWVFGINLRGTDVTLSRLTIVQSWFDTERAYSQEILGLLSPRRSQYSLTVNENSLLKPIPENAINSGVIFGSNTQTSTTIEQTNVFKASEFPVDASFIAAFDNTSTFEKPDISGQASLIFDTESNSRILRGAVQNNAEFTLSDPVILVRGVALHLEDVLEPGDVIPFEVTIPGEGFPSPAPLALAEGIFSSIYIRSYTYLNNNLSQSVADILGTQLSDQNWGSLRSNLSGTPAQQETFRRRLFLEALINEPYKQLTGRGNNAYLAGWTDQATHEVVLEGSNFKSLDTTLYVVQINVTIDPPIGDVVISPDQFTWFVQERTSLGDIGPMEIAFNPGDEAVIRFTPLPDSVLSNVVEMTLFVDRQRTTTRIVPLQLWNWEEQRWEQIEAVSGKETTISRPERFLGPENAVQIRLVADALGGFPRIDNLSIEQRGSF